jgi:anti-anti-sigma factor
MSVEAKMSDDAKTLTIKLSGRFDVSLHKSFSDSYKDKIGSISRVIVDMGNVEYIDSSGLGMMLVLRERIGGDDAKIDIVNVSPGIKKILETTNFDRLFNIE